MRKLAIHSTAITQPPTGSASLPGLIVPRMLRIQDAARYLSATTWFIETLIREGRIPSMVLGKRRVIDINDLDEWIEKLKAQASGKAAA
jgi:excisionase family DNA binding protein